MLNRNVPRYRGQGIFCTRNEEIIFEGVLILDSLNEGGTTKALRFSSLAWDEWRFLLHNFTPLFPT
jgi:hypothetical protein